MKRITIFLLAISWNTFSQSVSDTITNVPIVNKNSFGFHSSAFYAYRLMQNESGPKYTYNQRQANDRGIISYGYGIQYSRKLSEKWDFETGMVSGCLF